MKVASYWVREKRVIAGMQFRLQGYSFLSLDEARARLEEKAKLHAALYEDGAIAPSEYRARLRSLDEQPDAGEYSVVIAEELLEELDARNVITRNRYGAEVLNSEDTCFLDVDNFTPSRGLWARALSLFGPGKSEEELLLEAVRALCQEESKLGVRVYRTARGWRMVAAAPGLAPGSAVMEKLCTRLRVDALYCKLCIKQGCWRARLTPKPYRLRMPGVYPQPQVSNATHSLAVQEWLGLYKERSSRAAVCRLVDTLGAPVRSAMIELHDERTGALKSDIPLC